jgi:hypothetical protein
MDTVIKTTWNDIADFAVYCFDVNGFRVQARCGDDARYNAQYQYQFTAADVNLNANPDCTGEIMPVRGSIRIHDKIFDALDSFWVTSFSVTVWPKSDLGIAAGFWNSPEKIQAGMFDIYGGGKPRPDFHSKDYSYPKHASDIEVLTINNRLWGYLSFGNFDRIDRFCTELTEHLIIMVDFDASSCWPNDAPPPADIKSHVMGFFLDYLNHFDIILRDSVSEEQLPPLGFYPSRRDEKEIDAEGKTIESRSEAYASESLLKW